MYRPSERTHIFSKILLVALAILQVNPLMAKNHYIVAEASVKPKDLLPAFDQAPETALKAQSRARQEPKPKESAKPPAATLPQQLPPASPVLKTDSQPTEVKPVVAPKEIETKEVLPPPPSPAPSQPKIEEPTGPLSGKEKFLVNLSNVSMAEYIRFISRISNKNFIFNEEQLNFNVTIVSEELTTLDEIMASLMNELRIHGLSLIEQGNNIIIHNNPAVNSPSNIVPTATSDEIPPTAQIATRVFRLRSFDPVKARGVLAPLLSSQAVIEPLPETGILILTDLSSNIEKAGELLALLDAPASGLEIAQYQARSLYVDSLGALAQRILAPLSDEGKKIQFIPFRQTNTLFIVGPGGLVDKALKLLEQIDGGEILSESILPQGSGVGVIPGKGGDGSYSQGQGEYRAGAGGRTRLSDAPSLESLALDPEFLPQGHLLSTDFDLYRLQHRKGDQIQQALQSIATSLLQMELRNAPVATTDNTVTGAVPAVQTELASAISSVQWLEATNTLVFTGTRAANAKLKEIIRELDIQNDQVLIELLLLDTTLEDSLEYGVDWESKFGGPNAAGAEGFHSNALTPLRTVMNTLPTSGTINAGQLARSAGFSLGVIGQNLIHCGNTFGSIGALVRAIHRDLNSRVVLNQKIVVEDNQTAEIFVGLNIPYKTQSLANDFGTILTNNFEYRDVGARLIVTPFINNNAGIITLQLEQEVTTLLRSVAATTSVAFEEAAAGPSTRKSNTKTTIFVPDGYFVILSGNIQDENDRDRTQVPCLGGIPVIGSLFSEKRNRDHKRALMVFLRPILINTKQQIRDLTKREQDMYNQHTDDKDRWQYEVNEALEFLNIRSPNCAD